MLVLDKKDLSEGIIDSFGARSDSTHNSLLIKKKLRRLGALFFYVNPSAPFQDHVLVMYSPFSPKDFYLF